MYHHLTKDSPPKLPAASGPVKTVPSKSILKIKTHILTLCEDQDTRENTPEPSDPLANVTYLEHPVSKIISPDSSLKDLIEGYCVLAARLRNTVTEGTNADASWPLFQPLRKHNEAIVEAIVRDLGKALVDPLHTDVQPKEPLAEIDVTLPSPKPSPQKKKQGMTEEQVKHARDLCTTCHSVVKLLTTMFTLPAVYKVFSDEQLQAILNRVLDIPLTAELPTPNSRKTNALTISFLQAQRLPSTVLGPIAHRFELAIQRAIRGQLGKEGKRGAIADGLKAIEELTSYQPDTFVPFVDKLVPALLACLSARSSNIRIQACLALRGMVIGFSQLPYDEPRISIAVATILKKANRSKNAGDGNIVQTLRAALASNNPTFPSQGPVWGLCVLANLIILMGPMLFLEADLRNLVASLASLAMQHRKSSIRALACLVWRCMTWIYVQPKEDHDQDPEAWEKMREEFWKILVSVVDMGAGVATVVTVLDKDRNPDTLRDIMVLIKNMINKGGQTCGDAMDMIHHMVTPGPRPKFGDCNLLLQPVLKAMPNLLDVGHGVLIPAIKPLFQKCHQVDHVRSLTAKELTTDWIFDQVVEAWILGLVNLDLSDADEIPIEVVDIWIGLMTPNVKSLQDADDEQGLDEFARRVVGIIHQILQDPRLDFVVSSSSEIPTSPVKGQQSSSSHRQIVPSRLYSNAALKISLAHALWTGIRRCPDLARLQDVASRILLEVLVQDETKLIGGAEPQEDARERWAGMCADVLATCDMTSMRWFWEHGQRVRDWTPSQVGFIWRTFIAQWQKASYISWETVSYLLIVPFTPANSWDLSEDDLSTWDKFLFHVMEQALGFDIDSITVMDNIARIATQEVCPGTCKSLQAADLFVSHLELTLGRGLPQAVLRFVNDALQSSYPPAQYNHHSLWLIRSLTNVIDACPWALVELLLEGIQEGLCTWISDKQMILTQDEYSYNIVPLYQTAVVSFQALPLALFRLEKLSPLLESSFCGREDKPSSLLEAFVDFWQATYANETPPDGWPEKIQNCLRASFALSDAVPFICEPSATQEDALCYAYPLQQTVLDEKALLEMEEAVALQEEQEETDSESEVEEEILPERPPLFDFARKQPIVDEENHQSPPALSDQPIPVLPATPSTPLPAKSVTFEFDDEASQTLPLKLWPNLNLPSTPVRKRHDRPWSSTPPRPRKPYTIPNLHSPSMPLATSHRSTLPNRSPLSFIGGRPNVGYSRKRTNDEDKENMSPQPAARITSTPEHSIAKPSIHVLGKRAAFDDEERHQASPKKRRVDTDVPVGSPFFNVTEIPMQSLSLPSPENVFITRGDTSNEAAVDPPVVSTPKKRKRLIMECVELPTLRQIRYQQRQARNLEALFTPPPSRSPRRRGSTSNAQLNQAGRWGKGRGSLPESHTGIDAILTALREAPVLGSDDSITHSQNPASDALQPDQSSDDDPYDGQVTPHHLISPALRRVRKVDNDDPPSDDSIISNSPTRVAVARRLERLGQPLIDRIQPLA